MTIEETMTPLVNIGAFARPATVICCEDHHTPAIVFTIVVGEHMFSMVVAVQL